MVTYKKQNSGLSDWKEHHAKITLRRQKQSTQQWLYYSSEQTFHNFSFGVCFTSLYETRRIIRRIYLKAILKKKQKQSTVSYNAYNLKEI